MREDAERHVEELRRIIGEAILQLSGEEVAEAREKRAGVSRSVSELERPAESWTELLREVTRVLATRHPDDFERVLEIQNNRGRPMFRRDPSNLERPLLVAGTDLHVWGHVGGARAPGLVARIARAFGYDSTRFAVLESD